MSDIAKDESNRRVTIALAVHKIDALTALVARWREEDREKYDKQDLRIHSVEISTARNNEWQRGHEKEHGEIAKARRIETAIGSAAAAIVGFLGWQR
jgi:hypothetical protein